MGCLTVKLTRVDANLKVVLAPVCATDAGMPILYGSDGARLYEEEGKLLTYKNE